MAAGHSVIISGLMILAALVVSVISGRSNAAMLFFRRIFACGIFGLILLMGYMNVKTMEDSGKTADRIAEKKTCQMIGLVDDIRRNSKGYQVYIQAESIDIYNVDMKVIVYMSDDADMKIGQQFAINGDFARPDTATNPGEFDALSYYAHRGIYLICKGGTVAGKGTGYSPVKQYLYQFRMRAGEVLDKHFDESDSSVMRAMLLGEKSGIDKDTKKLFQINGIAHILAISGVKTLKLDIPLVPETRINWAFVPLHIAIIYILKLCLDEEIIPRCRFPCSRGYLTKCINWQKK